MTLCHPKHQPAACSLTTVRRRCRQNGSSAGPLPFLPLLLVLLVQPAAGTVTRGATTPEQQPAPVPVTEPGQAPAPEAEAEAEATLATTLELRDIGMIQAHTAALLLSDQGGGEVEGAITWMIPPGPESLPDPAPVTVAAATGPAGEEPATTASNATSDTTSNGVQPAPVIPAGSAPGALATGEPTATAAAEAPPLAVHKVPVRYVVEVDGDSLLAQHDQEGLAIGVYGYAVAWGGGIVDHFAYGTSVSLADFEQQLRRSGLRLSGELQLPPGRYSLRLLVRNHQTDGYYLGRTVIDVPGRGDRWAALPPVLPARGEWLEGRIGGTTSEQPFQTAEGPMRQAARAVLVDDQPTTLCVGGVGWDEAVTVSARLVDYHGRTYDEPEVLLAERLDDLPDGLTMRRATIAAVNVPAGKYRLVLGLQGTEEEQRSTRTVPVLVVPQHAPQAWAAIDLAKLQRERTLSRDAQDHRTKLRDLEIHATYREALAQLANGDDAGARRTVAELERAAFAISPAKGLLKISEEIGKMARDLADVSPESLTAVVKLHHDLVHSYSVHAEHTLCLHAWTLTADLAELSCAKAHDDSCRLQAADTLVSLACYLLEADSSESATVLFNRALRFNPAHPVALFGLAVIHERMGEYSMAISLLERLTKVDPSSDEVRLHLAINAGRVGHRREATGLFRELTRSDVASWIRAVAYQEAAQMLVATEHPGQAEKLLREAIRQLPENQRLQIQLAFVLDLNQRPVEAAGVLQQLRPQREAGEESPRMRYASWRPPAFAQVRHQLDRIARGSFQSLGKSLQSLSSSRRWSSHKKQTYLARPRFVEPRHTLRFSTQGAPVGTRTRRRSVPAVRSPVAAVPSSVPRRQPNPKQGG